MKSMSTQLLFQTTSPTLYVHRKAIRFKTMLLLWQRFRSPISNNLRSSNRAVVSYLTSFVPYLSPYAYCCPPKGSELPPEPPPSVLAPRPSLSPAARQPFPRPRLNREFLNQELCIASSINSLETSWKWDGDKV